MIANHDNLSLSNAEVAEHLVEVADLLEVQHAGPFRVRAYRSAADIVRQLPKPVEEILEDEGIEGLTRIRGIGNSLARSIEQLAETGRLALLERLRGDTQPESILSTVPGIGPKMAERIHEQLDIETLADLEQSAYDGRLAQVPGMGRKRLQGVRESLAGRFRRRPQVPERPRVEQRAEQPPVAELLDIDREYREKAAADRLPRIAPRRFNPTGEAWLPILHTDRDDRHYTALFSNTARAHELGMTDDWVVIYRDDRRSDGQWTVITSRFGQLEGRRIVRGREAECSTYYEHERDRSGDPSPTLFDDDIQQG
jgi:Holliday junction resolvasome RuvABC DNA-binding subunit